MQLSAERFEELVAQALDEVPADLAALMDNVAVLIEQDAPAEEPGLLGLYLGTPLTERDSSYTFVEPDRILIFAAPLLARCADEAELIEQVRITVVHEIAHHFGIEEDRLHELGWG